MIRKPDVSRIEFHAPEKRELKLSAIAKPSINVKPFKKPQDIKTELPEFPKVNKYRKLYKTSGDHTKTKCKGKNI